MSDACHPHAGAKSQCSYELIPAGTGFQMPSAAAEPAWTMLTSKKSTHRVHVLHSMLDGGFHSLFSGNKCPPLGFAVALQPASHKSFDKILHHMSHAIWHACQERRASHWHHVVDCCACWQTAQQALWSACHLKISLSKRLPICSLLKGGWQ